MKKILLGTTAIVASAFAGSALAKDVELKLGGYMRVGVGFSEYTAKGDEAEENIHLGRDGEIHFKGKGTLDNGLTVTARVELEAFTTGDQIDENWVAVESSFGQVMIGGNDDAAANMHVGILGITANSGYHDETWSWVPGGAVGIIGSSDAIGIHYYTPSIAGFTLGVSYQPDTSSDGGTDGQNTGADNDDQRIAVGAAYENSFGEFDVALSGGYITEDDSDDDSYSVGAELGFSGFTVAGTYMSDEGDDIYSGGVRYATGPWTVTAGYAYQDADELTRVAGGVDYKLGDGVSVGGVINYGEFDDGETDDDGFGGALLLGVSF